MPDWVGTVLEVIGALGGGGVIVGGFAWLLARKMLARDRARHQKELEGFKHEGSTLLESQRQAGARELFVHQLQFKTEFDLYVDLWKVVRDAGAAASEHASKVQLKEDDTNRTIRADAFKKLNDAIEEVEGKFLYNAPFYSPEVLEAVASFRSKLSSLHLMQEVPPDPPQCFTVTKEIKEKLDDVRRSSDALASKIRERVWL